jgi:hypothetical protein
MIARRLLSTAAALFVVACATTTIRDAWTDPAWRGNAFRKVVVLGVVRDTTERRVFEDLMVKRIEAAGAEAVPAYRYLPSGAKADEATLDRVVRESGASALVMSRIRSIDRRTEVVPVMVPGPGPYVGPYGPGWYGFYSGWYPTQEIRQYDIAVVETSVFDAATRHVVWTGVTETYQPTSVAQDGPGFADVIVKALQQRGILPGGK